MDQEQRVMSAPTPTDGGRRWVLGLAVLLAVAAALRVVLAWRGGQLFWSDETRYYAAQEAWGRIQSGELAAAARLVLGGADHLLFKLAALVPAAIQAACPAAGFAVPATFFALASVANIALVARAARVLGAGPREALAAAALQAAAATHFYYARHLFPYDLSLTFGLLALGVGWGGGRERDGAARSVGAGVLAGLGFLTYAGGWLFNGIVLVGHVLSVWPDWRRGARRALQAGAGLALPVVTAVLAARLAGTDLVASFLQFSGSLVQGDFGRGRPLLVEYFWGAEGLNALLGVAAVAVALAGAAAARRWTRGAAWAAAAVAVLVVLVALSDFWPKFVIYGRTARFVVPFVCLAGAFVLERLWRLGGGPGRVATALLGLVLAQGLANFWMPLRQVFPYAFNHRAAALKEELRARGEKRQLVIVHGAHLVGRASLIGALPDHDVLYAEANPMQYSPYLYEGFPEIERAALRAAPDLRMRLIAVNRARFDHPAELQKPYPGAVQLTLLLPDVRPPGVAEPLVVTGETGAGDLLYLVYQADGSIRLGFDHWGVSGLLSDPIPVNPAKPVVIAASLGPLHDPAAAPVGQAAPQRWLYASVNGRVVWSQPAVFHAAPPDSISYLSNYIGGSTAGKKFTGRVKQIQSLLIPPFGEP